MESFLKFFDEIRDSHGFALEIYSSSIMDWCISVGYKRTMKEYGTKVIQVQNCDIELCFAKAQVELKEWLLENEGGY